MQPKIGVVTVLYNSASVLEGFFDSLDRQTFSNFHVWAIDNASRDSSAALASAHGERVTVLANQHNVGVAAANNQGIRSALNAGCTHVLLLNNDVEFGSDLFQALMHGLDENHCEMTAPVMYYHDRPDVIWAAGGKFQPILGYRCVHLGEGTVDHGQLRRPRQIDHAPTCCVLFKRSVFERVGLMDERYFVYHDDTDFMLRCLKAGQRLFLIPTAHLQHKVSSLTGGAESHFSVEMGTRNRIFLLTKFLGRLAGAPYVAAISVAYLLRRLTGAYSPQRHQLKQRNLRRGFLMAPNWMPYRTKKPTASSLGSPAI